MRALYGIKVSACNLVGCSSFTSELAVDARGNPTQGNPTDLPGKPQLLPPEIVDGLGGLLPGAEPPSAPTPPGPGPGPDPNPDGPPLP